MNGTFDFHSPADLAREHYEHEAGARYDYLQEAFGAEARLLAQQDADEREYEGFLHTQQVAREMGITDAEAYFLVCQDNFRYLADAAKVVPEDDDIPF